MVMRKRNIINKKILLLTLTDVFSWGPFYIISYITAIYLANKLGENVVEIIGIGTAIYYFVRGVLQVPVGYISDKLKTNNDESIMLIIGLCLMGITYILYPLISSPWHYYLLQLIFGIGTACNVTNWRKLFENSISDGAEGRQYAFYEAIMSIATAAISVVIGYAANLDEKSFDSVLMTSGSIMLLSSIFVFLFNAISKKR